MIITRTPFRISFAGGGSDLPSFYANEPGAVLSTAIDKYMYITAKERPGGIFKNTYRVSYSQTEIAGDREEIHHPIVRESLKALDINRRLEIVSIADLPAQAGMGSSSSFTVGLLQALHTMEGHTVSPKCLAEQACQIEIDRLQEPIGKQDQYIAAYGGLQFIQFQPDGNVFVDPVVCSPETRRELNRRLMLFYTGITRNARDVLTKQRANTQQKIPVLRKLCEIAHQLRDILTNGVDLNQFGHLLHCAWQAKKCLEPSIHNSTIDGYYDRGLAAGALGGKLLGAGMGGFILFFCEPHLQNRLRDALSDIEEVPFALEPQGAKVIFVGTDQW
jgi:D-glycero-alpha-D-manno-heptose-7-phosphate kinase